MQAPTLVRSPLLGSVPHYAWPGQYAQNLYQNHQAFMANSVHRGQDRDRESSPNSDLNLKLGALSLDEESSSSQGRTLHGEVGCTRNAGRHPGIYGTDPNSADVANGHHHSSKCAHWAQSGREHRQDTSDDGDNFVRYTNSTQLTSSDHSSHRALSPTRPTLDSSILDFPVSRSSSSGDTTLLRQHSNLSSERQRSDESDEDDSHHRSLTITADGEFKLGPHWSVPDLVTAQELAGCNTERVEIKSVQYSEEHRTHFILTEQIDDFDLSMSGGLSAGPNEPCPLPGYSGRGLCSLPCFSRGDSPEIDTIDFPPNHPDRKASRSCSRSTSCTPRRLTPSNPTYDSPLKSCGSSHGSHPSAHETRNGTPFSPQARAASGSEQVLEHPITPGRHVKHKKAVSFALGDHEDDTEEMKYPIHGRQLENAWTTHGHDHHNHDYYFGPEESVRPLRRMSPFNRGSIHNGFASSHEY